MFPTRFFFGKLGFINVLLSLIFGATNSSVLAQIVPDATLPSNSIVTLSGNTFTIDGGTTVGSNLFHSLGEFSLPSGNTAFFNNAATIDNIITRVTGGQLSHIDGLMRANGKANFFLINPSGIIFGANAQLDIGGSFIGSTADNIQFADGSIFSATNPNASPLLTLNVPIGLQYGANPGEILVQGTGHSFIQPNLLPLERGNNTSGLRVQPGNTLALVGGNVTLDGGLLTAESGRIELGSVAEGFVSLSPTAAGWTLDYGSVPNFRDITLLSKAGVDVSGAPGGFVQIQGRNLEMRDSSTVLIQNLGSQPGGDIVVNLSETFTTIGFKADGSPPTTLQNGTVGSGDGGDIRVTARNLVFRDGGQVAVATYAPGKSGDIIANITDSVQLIGFALDRNGQPFFSSLLTFSSGNSGNLGDIKLFTRQLKALNGALVSSFNVGIGDSGNVEVNATESVELTGFSPGLLGSSLSSNAFNRGNASDVIVNTPRLVIRDGGQVNANTIAIGNAGNVTINASESVEISGTVQGSGLITPSQVGSAANPADPFLQQYLGLPTLPSGSPGSITINTPVLRVTDGALVTVQNIGTGGAGSLSIRANSIFLSNGGGITASTNSGEGGNINLQVRDVLQLRQNALISAEAGRGTGNGNGGNLTIDAPFIIALENENSDIIANADAGNGGNINITATGIYGLVPTSGPLNNSISEINASSQTGIQGNVTINNPEVDPSSGLVKLPEELSDSSNQVVSGCGATEGNSFMVTGRGGLPEDPTATIRGQNVWRDLQDFSSDSERANVTHEPSQILRSDRSPRLVEATGWVKDEQGHVTLVAAADNGISLPYKSRPLNCRQL